MYALLKSIRGVASNRRSLLADDEVSDLYSQRRHDQIIRVFAQSEDAYYESIDLECDDHEESHYVGPTITLSSLPASIQRDPSRNVVLKFRNVSVDPRSPAIFVRNPTLVYGQSPTNNSEYLQTAINIVGERAAAELIQM